MRRNRPSRGERGPALEDLEIEEGLAEVYRLRLAGMRPVEIARTLGIHKSTVSRRLKKGWRLVVESNSESREQLRQLELDRLDALLRGVWVTATAGAAPPAVDRFLQKIVSTTEDAVSRVSKGTLSAEDGAALVRHAISEASAAAASMAEKMLPAIDRAVRIIHERAVVGGLVTGVGEVNVSLVRLIVGELERAGAYAELERIGAGEDPFVVHGQWQVLSSGEEGEERPPGTLDSESTEETGP